MDALWGIVDWGDRSKIFDFGQIKRVIDWLI